MTKVKFAGCVFLMGPTASGKTALAVELAKALNGEVVSVDSALVYRGLDIGTAKPDSNEQQGIPHHLIDICDPAEAYSAARFCQDALSVVNDVRSRGATPILAGGTMLYFYALEHGLSPLPEANSAIRDDIDAEAERMGWEGIHQQLQAVDPESAARIHPNDPQRLQRALEVFRVSGETLSVLQKRKGPKLDTPIVKIALQPSSRQWLHDRIAQRFDQMLQSGFIEEVRALHSQGLDPALPSMRAVGYRQALLYLNGEFDASTFRDKGIAATRQLAKRQLTWLRGMSQTLCIPCDTVPLSEQLSISLQGIASHE